MTTPALQTNKNLEGTVDNWQQFQTIYHQITGKKETLKKNYSDPYQYKLSDIEDLHYKIVEAAKSYNLVSQNHNVSITYEDKSKPTFSSYERFKIQASSGATAIQSLTLEYNFAFRGSQTNETSYYKISVNLFSGIAVFSEIEKEFDSWWGVKFAHTSSGRATIEYVDYAIGQNFLNIITGWFNQRRKAPANKLFTAVQKRSYWIPRLTRFIFAALAAYISWYVVGNYIEPNNNLYLARSIVFIAFLTLFFIEIGHLLGRAIEHSVDRLWKLAYIELNPGDVALIERVKQHNRKCWISVSWKFAVYILLATVSLLVKEAITTFFL